MLMLGVDTGANGAIAVVDFNVKFCEFIDMGKDGDHILLPEVVDNVDRVNDENDPPKVWVERVWARPGQSAKTTWAQAALATQTIFLLRETFGTYDTCTPNEWKKALGLIAPKGSSVADKKRLTLDAARRWWPWVEGINLAKHDGRADALCIAWYGYKFGGRHA